jgi:hypothetical protein
MGLLQLARPAAMVAIRRVASRQFNIVVASHFSSIDTRGWREISFVLPFVSEPMGLQAPA